MLRPVLDIHVLWHPAEAAEAQAIALDLAEHFQGGAFASLLSGAVEVYVRSAAWADETDAPRPIVPGHLAPQGPSGAQPTGAAGGAPGGAAALSPAVYTAVVPIVGLQLARAVEDAQGRWHGYLSEIVQAQARDPEHLRLLPLRLPGTVPAGRLAQLLSSAQYLAEPDVHAAVKEPLPPLRHRDLAQGLAQWIGGRSSGRLQVFVSHTKRQGTPDEAVGGLLAQVREVLGSTRVRTFFDAHDLQPGEDWDRALRDEAGASALLALRTDLYATRAWCQREMLTAKVHGMPVVVLEALTQGEARGSFLMDHTPRIPVLRDAQGRWSAADVSRAVNLLADAWLHRVLWLRQRDLAAAHPQLGRYRWVEHAPEPSTFAAWLPRLAAAQPADAGSAGGELRILHPDPPLGPDECEVLGSIAALAGFARLDLATPRLLASRGA